MFSLPNTRRSHGSRWLPLLILAAGLVVTCASAYLAHRATRKMEDTGFQRRVERVANTLAARIEGAGQAVHSAQAMLLAHGQIDRREWSVFCAAMEPYFQPGVVGLGFVERVLREQIPTLEQRIRAEGVSNFSAGRDGTEPDAFIVTLIEPLERNASVLGLDLGAGQTRWAPGAWCSVIASK